MKSILVAAAAALVAILLAGCGSNAAQGASRPSALASSPAGAPSPAAAPSPAIIPWSKVDKASWNVGMRSVGAAGMDGKTIYDVVAADCKLSPAGLKSALVDAAERMGQPRWITMGIGFVCPGRTSEASGDMVAVNAAQPKGTYQSTCDYELGDFTENTTHGYRFTADAILRNTGGIGTVDTVTATWHLAGGGLIKKTKQVRLARSHSMRVSFLIPATGDQIDSYQQIDNSGLGQACGVKVTMINTFH